MRYRLINLKTKEETICEKVVVDGSDYYISDKFLRIGDYGYWEDAHIVSQITNLTAVLSTTKKILATSNPNSKIPKVIDLIERDYVDELDARRNVANDFRGQVAGKHPYNYTNSEADYMIEGYLEGYNRSQETHPFTEEDVIDFATFRNGGDVREEFKLWKEQRIKTLYYQ